MKRFCVRSLWYQERKIRISVYFSSQLVDTCRKNRGCCARKESPCTHCAHYRQRRLRPREQTPSVFRALIEFHTIKHLPVSNNADVWSLYFGARVIYHVLCMHTVPSLRNVIVNNLTMSRGRRERNDEWFLIFFNLTFITSYKSA